LLFLMHVRNVGLVLALVLLIGWRARMEPWRGLGYSAGLAIMGSIKIAVNLRFWGSAVTTPHEHLGTWLGTTPFLAEAAIRTLGMLFDARHGLLLSAPIYLIAPASWFVVTRRSPAAGRELLVLVAGYLVFIVLPVTNPYGWRGGWSPAARFLVPVAPFLALPVPLLLADRNGRRVVSAVIALQLAIDALFWGRPMLLWSEGPGPAPFLEIVFGRSLAAMLPAWERLDPPALVVSIVGLGLWAALTWTLLRAASPTSRGPMSDRDPSRSAHLSAPT
jgi:hypothetical protein